MNLHEHKWASFKVSDIFTISTGNLVNKSKMQCGNNPRITAKATDNGIDSFTDIAYGFRTNHNCVSISFLGNCFYQPYLASYDMKIHSVTIKGRELNRHIGLFLANQLNREFKKFSYGNQLSSKDLARQHVLLPATANGQPDWQFMEDFMRQKEQQILKPTIEKLCKQLISNEIGGGNAISSITSGKHLILLNYLILEKGSTIRNRPAMRTEIYHLLGQQTLTMVLLVSPTILPLRQTQKLVMGQMRA